MLVDPPLIRITHPFHPLQGQPFRFVVAKQLWGEERVTFEHPAGGSGPCPSAGRMSSPADPYLSIGRGRSHFRVEDLVQLADAGRRARGRANRPHGAECHANSVHIVKVISSFRQGYTGARRQGL